MHYLTYLDSSLGPLTLVAKEDALTHLLFLHAEPTDLCPLKETPLLLKGRKQLQEYFAEKRTSFTLPLSPEGTPFQQRVWAELQKIPYGETRNYGQIARAIGNPHGARAVGNANHHNPLPIFIPCHRVVGADGSMVGYAGGLDRKLALLFLEQQKEAN